MRLYKYEAGLLCICLTLVSMYCLTILKAVDKTPGFISSRQLEFKFNRYLALDYK